MASGRCSVASLSAIWRQPACLARLDASSQCHRSAAHLFLKGDIARHERRFAEAEQSLDEAYARSPFYECWRARAQVGEATGNWARPAAGWNAVLAAKGQIIQDGFTPDLELARAGLKRASGHLSRKDE